MSIGGINTSMAATAVKYAQGSTMDQVSTKMLGKALDQQTMEGNGVLKMMDAASMERSVNESVGGNFDMRV